MAKLTDPVNRFAGYKKQPKPNVPLGRSIAPQVPPQGTTAQNHFK